MYARSLLSVKGGKLTPNQIVNSRRWSSSIGSILVANESHKKCNKSSLSPPLETDERKTIICSAYVSKNLVDLHKPTKTYFVPTPSRRRRCCWMWCNSISGPKTGTGIPRFPPRHPCWLCLIRFWICHKVLFVWGQERPRCSICFGSWCEHCPSLCDTLSWSVPNTWNGQRNQWRWPIQQDMFSSQGFLLGTKTWKYRKVRNYGTILIIAHP